MSEIGSTKTKRGLITPTHVAVQALQLGLGVILGAFFVLSFFLLLIWEDEGGRHQSMLDYQESDSGWGEMKSLTNMDPKEFYCCLISILLLLGVYLRGLRICSCRKNDDYKEISIPAGKIHEVSCYILFQICPLMKIIKHSWKNHAFYIVRRLRGNMNRTSLTG